MSEVTARRISITLPVRNGDVYADLVLTLDLEKIAREIGPKAMINRRRKSMRFGDAIIGQAINFRSHP